MNFNATKASMALGLLILTSCAPDSTSTTSKDSTGLTYQKSAVPYQVAVLDKVFLSFADKPEVMLQVTQEGAVTLPAGDTLNVLGQTPDQLTATLQKADPKLTSVRLEEFRGNRVSVVGEVNRQLYTDLTEAPMRVLDAIAAANGFSSLANTHHVKLIRQNAGVTEVYELDLGAVMKGQKTDQNMLLKAGDVIVVSRNFL